MAQAGHLTQSRAAAPLVSAVTWLRIGIIAAALLTWQAAALWGASLSKINPALSTLLSKVTPSLLVVAESLAEVLFHPDLKWPIDLGIGSWRFTQELWIPSFYWHLYVTAAEVVVATIIGGLAGIAVGIALGAKPFLSRAFERYFYYLGPTPKVVFFPILILWFGVGPESKIAMGTLSCFFPIVLSVAAGMRQIDGVLIRVGRSFRLNSWQMVTKIYLPAMRQPILNGVRLGMGVALIGTLLAETRLSNKGIGFMVTDAYNTFDMPRMYAVLVVLFAVAIGANALVARVSRR